MAKPLSADLRARVIAAVDGGLSRRAAAARFGAAAASAVRWVREWRETGAARARQQGGDRRSHRIEAYRDIILTAIESQVDISRTDGAAVGEAWGQLRREHDVALSRPSCRYHQKKRRTPASRSGPTSPRGDTPGSRHSLILIRHIWCSLMRPEHRPRWPGCVDARSAACDAARRYLTAIGKRQHSPGLCV